MAWQKNNYSLDEIARMQREAEQRVEDMRRRSADVTRSANMSMGFGQPAPKPSQPGREPQRQQNMAGSHQNQPPQQQKSQGISLDGLAKSLGLEGDRLMVLLLVVLLLNEKADPKLILALMWIII